MSNNLVFLLDVDNTLLDNDAVEADLSAYLTREFGAEHQRCYWAIFEQLRAELGYADFLGALQRYRLAFPHEPHMLAVSSFLLDYPFASRLFPGALDVIELLSAWGTPAILSDGDAVFQARKVERSGLATAVQGRVLIYIHKERELDDVLRRFPARHYVLVDDKLRLLDAVRRAWGGRVTTVQPLQGHYAANVREQGSYPPADVTVRQIGDLLSLSLEDVLGPASAGALDKG